MCTGVRGAWDTGTWDVFRHLGSLSLSLSSRPQSLSVSHPDFSLCSFFPVSLFLMLLTGYL